MRKSFLFRNKKISYKTDGKGKTIVLLHGFPFSLNLWDDITYDLLSEFRVISIDLPGFGDSEMLSEIHTMELMADAVKACLEENNIRECIVMGHSMGGYVALEFANKYPEILKGVGLIHSHPFADNEEGKENRNRTIETVKKNHKNFLNYFISELFAPDNVASHKKDIERMIFISNKASKEGVIAAIAGMRDRPDRQQVIKDSRIPYLFILGRCDKKIPVNKMKDIATSCNTSQIFIMGNVSHMSFIENKKETINAIHCFASSFI